MSWEVIKASPKQEAMSELTYEIYDELISQIVEIYYINKQFKHDSPFNKKLNLLTKKHR